ncbi:hypothetical protein PISMIDRAFT_680358 [Pisolithus microcarpus 441]|uniref:Uncharacterized protein n=1 Tax=Pisolithus microcarpus 441 TaxID=765257 RepID=A0A0C9ZIJ8_9AGAM|nr:hypothetical protein PISMIDRAFT_680358 [Pisolithus microcarpus 441]
MSSGQELFMSIGVSLVRTPDVSFEEQRLQDYIHAYMTTNRPPAPCPQTPTALVARTTMGLPPLFVPVAVPATHDNGVARLLVDLPTIHAFEPLKSLDESFQCISAQPLYSHFLHEELRYHAYAAGNKVAPPPTLAAPSSRTSGFYANDSPATAYLTTTINPGSPDFFMSITAAPTHEKRSFEELRIEHLLGRKGQPPSIKIYDPSFGRHRGAALSVPQPSPLRMF